MSSISGDSESNSDTNVEPNSITDISMSGDPYLGMSFDSIEEAYYFYNCYALQLGFGIRKSSTTRSHKSGFVISKRFECDKAGIKNIIDDEGSSSTRQRETRTRCKARLDLRKNDEDKWIIRGFIKEHNHELDTPKRAKKHRSHNILHKNHEVKMLMDQLHSSGIGPSKIARALKATIAGSSISAKHVSMHLNEKRKNNIGKEGALVYAYLQKQKELDANFFFAIELDTHSMLRSFFWADSRARNDYFTFGDVLVFDVTYKTNKFMMPFAPFTGVNHHRQSILFGCALLADEREETFVWLFSQWKICMFDKAPQVILTDMDGAMYNAIKIVFPGTRHRFCSWHIGKHLVEHVSEMRDFDNDFKHDYNEWLKCRDVSSSEASWEELIHKYALNNNNWLAKMYERRVHWVPVYLKDVFTAGMTSTGRSESINSFFDGFVNSRTQLLEFVMQYEKALQARREAEEQEDHVTLNSTANLSTNMSIEKVAAHFYTRNVFKRFQHEFKQSLECWYEEKNIIDAIGTYKVGLSNEETINWCTVIFSDSNTSATCECAKFETDGILCKHILHIMIAKKHLQGIPDQYLLNRWSITVRNHIDTEAETATSNIVTPMMKWRLTGITKKIFDQATTSTIVYEEVFTALHSLASKFDQLIAHDEPSIVGTQIASNLPFEVSIRDPHIVRTKGRPKISSRIESGIEISQSNPKKRTCGSCGLKGHYATTCPNKKKAA